MTMPLYLRGKSPRCPLDKRLGGLPGAGLDAVVKKKNTFPAPAGNEIQVI